MGNDYQRPPRPQVLRMVPQTPRLPAPSDIPVSGGGYLPLTLEDAIAWCVQKQIVVRFTTKNKNSYVSAATPSGITVFADTFIEAIELLQDQLERNS